LSSSFERPAQVGRDGRTQRPIALLREQLNAESRAGSPQKAASKQPRQPLARPPLVSSGQLLRAAILVLAGLVYADFPWISHALTGPREANRSLARVAIDPTPTASLPPKALGAAATAR